MELQSRYRELQDAGLGLAVITYDSPEVLRTFAERYEISFPLLSDPGSRVIRAFGLLNPEHPPGSRAHGIPYPGTFVCDPGGRVIARFFESSYRERVTVGLVTAHLQAASAGARGHGENPWQGATAQREVSAAAASRLDLAQVEITTSASDDVIAPGNRFSLLLAVTPKPGVHVYAPGDHSYRPIRLVLEPQLGLQVHPIEYPEAELYRYEPLDETVPVFSRPFRLVQDLTLPVSRETRDLAGRPGATLTLQATLEYQCCTADRCYHPQKVPLSWTFSLRPLE